MVLGQQFVADMVDGASPDSQLRKPDHHDRNHDDGGIETKPGCPEPARKDHADGQVAQGYGQIAPKQAEDVTQIGSFGQMSGNKKMH